MVVRAFNVSLVPSLAHSLFVSSFTRIILHVHFRCAYDRVCVPAGKDRNYGCGPGDKRKILCYTRDWKLWRQVFWHGARITVINCNRLRLVRYTMYSYPTLGFDICVMMSRLLVRLYHLFHFHFLSSFRLFHYHGA